MEWGEGGEESGNEREGKNLRGRHSGRRMVIWKRTRAVGKIGGWFGEVERGKRREELKLVSGGEHLFDGGLCSPSLFLTLKFGSAL